MSQAVDQEGFRADKYEEIIALLSAHKQGRDFLDQFVDGLGSINDNIFSYQKGSQGQKDILASIELLEKKKVEQNHLHSKMKQISQSLVATTKQLKVSGENSIAVRVLEDVVEQLASLEEDLREHGAQSDNILAQLEDMKQVFLANESGNKVSEKAACKGLKEGRLEENKSFF